MLYISAYIRHWPVEVLRQFDALLCFQVSQATQKASAGVKGHFEELEHSKERQERAVFPDITDSREIVTFSGNHKHTDNWQLLLAVVFNHWHSQRNYWLAANNVQGNVMCMSSGRSSNNTPCSEWLQVCGALDEETAADCWARWPYTWWSRGEEPASGTPARWQQSLGSFSPPEWLGRQESPPDRKAGEPYLDTLYNTLIEKKSIV